MSQWSRLKEQAVGKWQMPLFALSMVMLGVSLLRLFPASDQLPPEQALTYLDNLIRAGIFDEALQSGEALLVREDFSDAVRVSLHLRIARARYGLARERKYEGFEAGRTIAEHYRDASAGGEVLNAEDYEHLGHALEWQRRYANAVQAYQQAIDQHVPGALDLRRHILDLQRDYLELPPTQFDEQLDDFMAELGEDRPDLTLWVLAEKLDVLDSLGRLDHAATLLARHEKAIFETFETGESDLRERFRYLEAMLLYRTGHYDEAEVLLRVIRNRLERDDETYAMAGWLLGRIVTHDGGPQRPMEGLAVFEQVIQQSRSGPYVTASRIGLGEALAMLQRHEEAARNFKVAIEDLEELGPNRVVNRDVLRVSLGVTAETLRKEGQFEAALAYSELAATLIDRVVGRDAANLEQATAVLQQLVQLQALVAAGGGSKSAGGGSKAAGGGSEAAEGGGEQGELDDIASLDVSALSRESRELYGQAAETYLEIARLNALNEVRSSQALWRAAELLVRGGDHQRASELYHTFALGRPLHALVPRALLRIGQLQHGAGRWAAAVDAYQECYRRFPRTLDGARALVPLARCYLAMGPDHNEMAEKTLRIVLEESEVFTPEAPEFASALFLLGDALSRRGAFGQAIATLEQALQRYPDDSRRLRTQFLLADAFRQSGLAIKGDLTGIKSKGEILQLRTEALSRFTRARELFRALITEIEIRDPAGLHRLQKLYQRHAYLYEADCYFESHQYREAIKRYEEAAAIFKESRSGLAAYVQMINCHVFLGQTEEARAAFARAQVLTDAIPAQAFEGLVVPESRRDWKRYFAWLGDSGLF
ncbi:MAG: tetratricopeptide repeat protein [Planctomycetes bacterium]|nr:tetratricopeptide repeat protein [Planctomycetota bacterium]